MLSVLVDSKLVVEFVVPQVHVLPINSNTMDSVSTHAQLGPHHQAHNVSDHALLTATTLVRFAT